MEPSKNLTQRKGEKLQCSKLFYFFLSLFSNVFFMTIKILCWILCWNCMGISNPRIVDLLNDFMRMKKHDIICLVETKSNIDKTLHLCSKYEKSWDWAAIPTSGLSGGIITFWNRSIGKVTPAPSPDWRSISLFPRAVTLGFSQQYTILR